MPSLSAHKALQGIQRAQLLRQVGAKIKREGGNDAQIYYHASLAATVAAWDSYVNNIIPEYFLIIANPSSSAFSATLAICQKFSSASLARFNTPNFENSRTLIVTCTGYDPYSDWTWPQRGMGVLQVQEMLNQVLKVRHSFAHGFAIPSYTWTQNQSGKTRLTSKGVTTVEALLGHLVSVTDRGMKRYINTTFGVITRW